MNWIKLTGVDKKCVFVNLSHFDTMWHTGTETRITFAGTDGTIAVRETPEQIFKATITSEPLDIGYHKVS